MSVILRPRAAQSNLHRLAEPAQSGRSLAALATAGSVVLALVLAMAIPVKADTKDDYAKALIAALVIGALAEELADQPQESGKPGHKAKLPGDCAISIQGDGQTASFYSENCLRDEGFKHSLPRACSSRATIFGERDRIFSAKCLRKAGYRVSDH